MRVSGEQGFTLVEVLVALLVLSVITIGVVSMFTGSLSSIIQSGDKVAALYQVQGSLEKAFVDEASDVQIRPWTIKFRKDGQTVHEVTGILRTAERSFGNGQLVQASVFVPVSVK